MKMSFLSLQYTVLIMLFLAFLGTETQAGADLTVRDVRVNYGYLTYHPGDAIQISYSIENLGDEQSDSYSLEFYASPDTTIAMDDYYLGIRNFSGVPAGSVTPRSESEVVLPDGIPLGNYYIGVLINCSNDTNPSNDTGYRSETLLIKAGGGPDLSIEELRLFWGQSPYYRGDETRWEYRIRNIGDEATNSYTVDLYLSTDRTITTSDYLIGHTSEGYVGTHQHGFDSGMITCLFPDDIPPDRYYVGMVVSCSGDIDLGNNTDYSNRIWINAHRPDIIVQSIFFEGVLYKPLDGICVGLVVRNTGIGSANSYDIDFYASSDGYIEPTDYYLGTAYEGSLEPDEEYSVSASVDFPEDIPNGAYYIGAIIRWSYDNGSGSSKGSSSNLVWIGAPVDIAVQSIGIKPGVYLHGEELVIHSLMKNVGEWIAESYTVDYYASTDAVITTDDYHIGYVERDELAPGEQHSYDSTYQVPFDIAEGNYYIGAIVTCPKEYELGNNTGCSEETIELVYPACYYLVFQSIEVTPGEYLPGDELVIYNLIKNGSESSIEGYAVDYYASIDTIITMDDLHLGYVEREGLAPGQQHSYETTCLIPDNLIMGNYYIGAIITCPIGSGMAKNTGCSEETIELIVSGGNVSGQMLYLNRDRLIEFPIRYALVEVYDADDNDDPNDDRMIGRTHTDQDGNYNVVVLNDEMSSQNIYVKVFADSPIGACPEAEGKLCSVRDEVFDELYYMKSDLYPHPGEESVEINMTADRKGGEFMVYDSIIESFVKAKIFFNISLPEVTTFWPAEEETSYFDPCNLSMHIAQDDKGDRDVIMHEYGHYIAEVFDFTQGDVGDNPIHYWIGDLRNYPIQRTDEQARNLTFRESWATLFSIATQYGDTSYPYSGDTRYQDQDEESGSEFIIDLEKDTNKKREPGEFYEHMNCCALWDIFDDHDDKVDDHDTLSDPNLAKIWTVLLASKPEDIKDFWDGWFACYDDYTSEITLIFQDHRMLFVKPNIPVLLPPAQNTPPVADAGPDQTVYQVNAQGVRVYFDGSGSYDPDGDKLTYEWRRYGDRISASVRTRRSMVPGTTTITLVVTDGREYDYDTVDITVVPTDPSTWE